MKKIIAFGAVLALLLTLASCGRNDTIAETSLDAKICAIEEDVYQVEPCDGSMEPFSVPAEAYWKATDDPSSRIAEVGVGDILRITFRGENITRVQAKTVNGVSVLLAPMVMVDGVVYVYTGEESPNTEKKAEGKITSQVPQSQEPTENGQSNFGEGFGYRHGEEGAVEVNIQDTWMIFETKAHKAIGEEAETAAQKNARKLLNDLDALTAEVMGKSAEEVHGLLGDPMGVRSDPDAGEQFDVYLVHREAGDREILIGYDENGSVDTVKNG